LCLTTGAFVTDLNSSANAGNIKGGAYGKQYGFITIDELDGYRKLRNRRLYFFEFHCTL